jgi:hypothetical protein
MFIDIDQRYKLKPNETKKKTQEEKLLAFKNKI